MLVQQRADQQGQQVAAERRGGGVVPGDAEGRHTGDVFGTGILATTINLVASLSSG